MRALSGFLALLGLLAVNTAHGARVFDTTTKDSEIRVRSRSN